MDNFTPLRNGILEHLRDGRICPFDLGVYVLLHLRADWSTGIYHGCAASIAYQFGNPTLREHIKKTLRRLRAKGYINYRKGDGERGGYPILLNKRDVTSGELQGTRLDAWKNGELAVPEYTPQNGNGTAKPESLGPKESPRPKREPPVTMPDWLPSESWQGFTEMRQRMNAKAWTSRAMTLTLNKLGELRAQGNDPAAVLDQSVMKGWKSVFPLKEEQQHNGTNGNSKGQRIQNNVASAVRAAARLSEQRRGTP
jgi:hypothetical protein